MKAIKKHLEIYYHYIQNLMKFPRRIGLHIKDFSIISDNCAGGYMYQYYSISYKTPAEGIRGD